MKLIFQAMFFSTLLFGVAFSVWAQNLEEKFPTLTPNKFVDVNPYTCAYTHAKVDVLTQNVPRDKTFIVIARLGEKDLKPNLNIRRLHNVRTYLTQAISEQFRRDRQMIIVAEGESVKGYGQIEFYLDGRLVEVIIPRFTK